MRAAPWDLVEVTVSACLSSPEVAVNTIPEETPPAFQFELAPGLPADAAVQRMLVKKHRTDDRYPSPYQIARDPSLRPRFRFPGVVTLSGQPVSRAVWLRVVDPQDSAPYASSEAHPDDNDDPMPKGTLLPAGCDSASCGASNGSPLRVVSDASGRVEVVLEGTDRYAGDNYQLEASFDESFRCATGGPGGTNVCAKSGMVTAWKRVYVAVNKMFRKGAFLTADVPPCAPPQACSIDVSDVCQFPTPPFRIRMIHAPSTEGAGGTGDDFWDEEVTVTSVTRSGRCVGMMPGVLQLDPTQAIRHTYSRQEVIDRLPRPYLADAVGLVTGVRSADYYVEDRSLIDFRVPPNDAPIFEQAFTETIWLTDRIVESDDIRFDGVIPYHPMYRTSIVAQRNRQIPDTQREWTARKSIRHAERFGRERNSLPNHQTLFLATRHHDNDSEGVTTVADGFNDTWMFLETIGSAAVAREALVHELAHQWSVNYRYLHTHPMAGAPGGHCDTALGCGERFAVPNACQTVNNKDAVLMFGRRAAFCVMRSEFASDPDNGNGEVAFHYVVLPNGQADSEWLRIRRREEPVPQFEPGRIAQ